MFARILRSRFKAGTVNQAVELFEQSVLPLCHKQAGFKGAYFLDDPKTGESVTITLWESEEAMLASERNQFFQQQVAKFIPYYEVAPVREAYEVILKEKARKRRPPLPPPGGKSKNKSS
jgi:heme-degrading monooxygenase HmoA